MDNQRPQPLWQETVVKRKRKYESGDPYEHLFLHRVDTTGQFCDEDIQLPENDPLLALKTLYYEIVDVLESEYSQSIHEERNRYLFSNYCLAKQYLEAFQIIRDKSVDVHYFGYMNVTKELYNNYLLELDRDFEDQLTDEEFYLVNQVLNHRR